MLNEHLDLIPNSISTWHIQPAPQDRTFCRCVNLSLKQSPYWGVRHHSGVAEAVQKSHPDVALEIWKSAAEGEIAQVQPTAYQVAGGYLKKIRAVYRR
jgi:hypothetical protein